MIRFLIVPDMLKNAPMFKPRSGAKGLAAGAGKSAMMRAQSEYIAYVCAYMYIHVYFCSWWAW